MEKKTLEFYEQNPSYSIDEQYCMEIIFRLWYDTKFLIHWGWETSSFEMTNSNLQKLWKTIIEKLEYTPYKISINQKSMKPSLKYFIFVVINTLFVCYIAEIHWINQFIVATCNAVIWWFIIILQLIEKDNEQ